VFALHDDDDPAGFQVTHQGVGYLGGQPLLHLRAPGVHLDKPGELGEAGDTPFYGRNVAHMRHSVERNQVMLAGAVHLDVLDQHHLVVSEVERGGQHVRGALPEPCEGLPVGPGDARRGVPQTVPVRVLTNADQQFSDRCLDPGLVEGSYRAVRLHAVHGDGGLGEPTVGGYHVLGHLGHLGHLIAYSSTVLRGDAGCRSAVGNFTR
jgi:hypothetical protein